MREYFGVLVFSLATVLEQIDCNFDCDVWFELMFIGFHVDLLCET